MIDVYSKIANEFAIERNTVKRIALGIGYTAKDPNDNRSFEEQVRSAVRVALYLGMEKILSITESIADSIESEER